MTELVIKNWTGDIIDYEKNGQVRQLYLKVYRFAKSSMGKELAFLKTVMNTRAN